MRKAWSVWTLAFIATFILSACASTATKTEGVTSASITATPPAQYATKVNPYSGKADAIAAGKKIYDTNCATCHGSTGKGDGPGGAALNPKPADLTRMSPSVDSDGYIFWRISEGGGFPPFKSAMPAWKSVLNETQIWQVVSYVRTLEK